MVFALLIPACLLGIAVVFAGVWPDVLCAWKHGTDVHGAIRKYNDIQQERWRHQCERAKRKDEPPPAPPNRLNHPTTF